MKSTKRRRVDVNLDELDRVLDGAREAPLSEADCDKLKSALHALAAMLAPTAFAASMLAPFFNEARRSFSRLLAAARVMPLVSSTACT